MDTMLGRTKGGNPARRCDLVPTRKETLARRHGDHRNVAYRHRRETERESGGLDGEGHRRAIPGLNGRSGEMTMWTRDELSTIGSADEVRIAPLRKNGSMPKSVTIWDRPRRR